MSRTTAPARFDAIVSLARERKQGTRERLLDACLTLVCERGYAAVSVEDILSAAEVSRPTFYRHFRNKGQLAAELYSDLTASSMPRFLAIRDQDWRDGAVVEAWILSLFDADRAKKRRHEVFALAMAQTPELVEPARQTIRDLIAGFAASIPAFALDPDLPEHRERWLEAWLIVFEILDQSNHAALGTGEANDPLIIRIMARRFLRFVEGG